MMDHTTKRLLVAAGLIWLAVWGYVGWRGYTLTYDAHGFIDQLPPGATVPQPVLTALDAGQAYTLQAIVWGAVVPLFLLLVGWVIRPMLRKRTNAPD